MDMDKRLDEFPEWDSMSLIIIINLLSDDFGITVDVEDAVDLITVGDIVKLVLEQKDA